MQPFPTGAVHHRQAIARPLPRQGIHPPARPLLGRHTADQAKGRQGHEQWQPCGHRSREQNSRHDPSSPFRLRLGMALTPSTMLPLGTPLPWTLMAEALTPVVGGPLPEPEASAGKPVLVLFLCPHCPFVKHIEPELTRLQQDFGDQVAFLAIRSNSLTTHPQDGSAGMTSQANSSGWR
ncbi:MAG: hypothetical protein ACK56I_17725, partial [bacterium]